LVEEKLWAINNILFGWFKLKGFIIALMLKVMLKAY
jgi:hypothetical protein